MVIRYAPTISLPKKALYFLNGEPLLAKTLLDKIISLFPNHNKSTSYLDNDFQWEKFSQIFASTLDSLPSLVKWYWLESPNNNLEKKLESFLEKFDKNQVLIIFNEIQNKKHRTKPWWNLLDQQGVIVDLWPLTKETEIHSWIKQTSSLPLPHDVLKLFTEHFGNNLLLIQQVLNYLNLFPALDPKKVIDTFLGYQKYDLYDLLNAVWQNNPSLICQIYTHLEHNITWPLILWGITNDLRTLWELKYKLPLTKKLPPTRHKILQERVQNLDKQAMVKWWSMLLTLEQNFKTGKPYNLLSILLTIANDG